MRSVVSVMLVVCLGLLVTVAASGELPLLPPLDRVHVQPSTVVDSASWDAPGNMSRLIRTYFGDQVRWRPFLERTHDEQSAHHTHYRVVREHRPRPSVQSVETRGKDVVEGGTLGSHDLVVQQFYLRGNPCASPLGSNPQTVAE